MFRLSSTAMVATGKRNPTAARDVATEIQTTLSAFYDAAFMDPRNRKHGLSEAAWSAFATSVRKRAMNDAASLTLGEPGSRVDALSITDASLSVRVLLDPGGRPDAAIAIVVFEASGTLIGGEPVRVSNRASFLLQPIDGSWVVVGYPQAKTEVESPSPTPSLSTTPTPTGSASPSPGASP